MFLIDNQNGALAAPLDSIVMSMHTKLPMSEAHTSNGDAAFLTSASIRQPANALGPRAQRTITRITEATRDVFLTRGYSGTTIDEIARLADVSRASFYTYFPSKREVLLAIGAHSASECSSMIDRLDQIGTGRNGLTQWVNDYFDFLDVHGSFSFAWTQAAHDDEEIRLAGMKRHLGLCKHLGAALSATSGKPSGDPLTLGVIAFSTLERGWNYSQLYADTIERQVMIRSIANTLWGAARQPGK